MNSLFKCLLVAGFGVVLFSCKKDNYAPPGNKLTGSLVYNGESIQVESNQVPYQIYEYGFGKVGPIGSLSSPNDRASVTPVFAQDGSYAQTLFNGTYKIVIPNGQGPFIWKKTAAGNPDTTTVELNGDQKIDLEVTPYYLIHDAQVSIADDSATATFKIEKIITDANAKNIERASLYINKTQFVSGSNNIAARDTAGVYITDLNNVVIGVRIPAITPTQNYVYARVGVKIVDVEDMIFSPLIKINF